MKNCTSNGINITIGGFEKWGKSYDPKNMFDTNGIIKRNVQPYYSNKSIED